MNRKVLFGAVAAVVALIALVLVIVNPFSPSIEERVSAEMDAPASCERAGWKVVAGEREKVWTCSWTEEHAPRRISSSNSRSTTHTNHTACVAIIEGEVVSNATAFEPC